LSTAYIQNHARENSAELGLHYVNVHRTLDPRNLSR